VDWKRLLDVSFIIGRFILDRRSCTYRKCKLARFAQISKSSYLIFRQSLRDHSVSQTPSTTMSAQQKHTRNFFSRLEYQYEVTFGLYMLTTTEKIVLSMCSRCSRGLIVDCIFISFFTMLVLSSWFYLPSHIATIARHVHYYLSPEDEEGLLDLR
jgi:hypothetical protein